MSDKPTPAVFPITWERVGDDGFRLMVPGGWLFHLVNEGNEVNFSRRTAPVFVPDPQHLWLIP